MQIKRKEKQASKPQEEHKCVKKKEKRGEERRKYLESREFGKESSLKRRRRVTPVLNKGENVKVKRQVKRHKSQQ